MDISSVNGPSSRRTLWPILAGLVVLFLSCLRPIANPSVWTHLAAGRASVESTAGSADPISYASPAPYHGNPARFYDRLLYRAYRTGGSASILIGHALLLTLGFGFLAVASLRWCSPLVSVPILLLTIWNCAPTWGPGPDDVSIAMIGILFFLLSRRLSLPVLALLIPLQILWSNLGPGSILGAVLTAAAGAGWILDVRHSGSGFTEDEKRFSIHLGIATGLLALLVFLSPGGFSWATLFRPERHSALGMFPYWIAPASAFFGPTSLRHLTSIALILAAAGLITRKERIPILPATAALIGAWVVIRSVYELTWFLALAFPFLCMSLESLARLFATKFEVRTPGGSRRLAIVLLTAGLILTAGWIVSGRFPGRSVSPKPFGLGESQDLFAGPAARILREHGVLPDRFAHLPYDGGPLAWELPDRKIFLDYRTDTYSDPIYSLAGRLFFSPPAERIQLMREFNIHATLINCGWPGGAQSVRDLLLDGSWALAYFDGVSALLLDRTFAASPALREAQAEGNRLLEADANAILKAAKSGRARGYHPRVTGAALLYSALGRDPEAAALFGLALAANPDMALLRLEYGKTLLRLNRPADAERELRLSLRRFPKNASAWSSLAHALSLQGRDAEAKNANEKAARWAPSKS